MVAEASFGTIRIAIIGGGLAGATLANALRDLPLLEIHVYETAPEFHERRAAVSLSGNAQRALSEIVPSANELLLRAGSVSMNSARVILGSGPDAGMTILDLAGADPGVIVHRAALLRELLAPLPHEMLSTSKKLVSIDPVMGPTQRVDALIGADGIFGNVRKYILGKDNPATEPVPGGWWDCRNLVPMDKAISKLGEQYFKEDRQYGWVGEGAFIMHDVFDNGTTLLLDQDAPHGYSQWEHSDAPSYVNGRVCIVGDAAHAMTPWQGSGAAQAIEDSMIMRTVLASIESSEQLESALQAYDEVRRPQTQHIVESSRVTGQIMTGQVKEIGLDREKMREALAERWAFIHDLDLARHKDDALVALQRRNNIYGSDYMNTRITYIHTPDFLHPHSPTDKAELLVAIIKF